MKVGKIVDGYKTPPNPKDISLDEMKQLYIDSYEGNL